jgi:hypothetical protein
MTKAQYFEMCDLLGSEPVDDQIPIEFDDLIQEVQEALQIYGNLQDCWDYMGGNYIGKNFDYIETVFKFYNIEPESHKYMYELLMTIDRIRAKQIQDSKPKDTKAR